MIPSYPKVLAIGTRGTERLLEGPVLVQEKIDGSQFRWAVDAEGDIEFASHHAQIFPDAAGDFAPAVEHILGHAEWLRDSCRGYAFYGEFMRGPRQNTLTYERAPKGHLVLYGELGDGGTENWAIAMENAAGVLAYLKAHEA